MKTKNIMMFNVLCRRCNGVLNRQKTNKENVPLQIISNTIQRLAKTNRGHVINLKGKWSSESLEVAMDVVERGITSLQGANKFWGKRITSLFNHLYGKTISMKIGPPSVLTEE
jgi:hypothetical protein